jgi:hypothetical protein
MAALSLLHSAGKNTSAKQFSIAQANSCTLVDDVGQANNAVRPGFGSPY